MTIEKGASHAPERTRGAGSAVLQGAREVQAPSKLVHSEAYDPGTVGDDFPNNDALVTVSFDESAGATTVTSLIDFGSKEARDAAMSTGMTDGMEQSNQGLDRLLDEHSSH